MLSKHLRLHLKSLLSQLQAIKFAIKALTSGLKQVVAALEENNKR